MPIYLFCSGRKIMKNHLSHATVSLGVIVATLMFTLCMPVFVHAGDITGNVSTSDEGFIYGSVSVTAIPVVSAPVSPYCGSDSSTFTTTVNMSTGDYSFAGTGDQIPAGSYKVQFTVNSKPFFPSNYQPQWYNNVATEALATVIQVSANGTVSNINAVLQPGATISGTVTGTGGALLEGISVVAESLEDYFDGGLTGFDGAYQITGLPPGSYTLHFSENQYSSPRVAVPATMYASKTYPSAVVVTGAVPVIDKNIQLSAGGVATGSISQTNIQAIINITNPITHETVASGYSNNGSYTIGGLPGGTFTVTISAQTGGYIAAELTNRTITAGQTTNLGTTTLQPGGRINGTVRNTSQVPLQNVLEVAFDATSGAPAGVAMSAANGAYSLGGLKTGSYKVQFIMCEGGVATQWFNGKTTQEEATPVQVVAPGTVNGIDGTLNITGTSSFQLNVSYGVSAGGSSVNDVSSPAGIHCTGATCQPASYAAGTSVSLVATPDSISSFAGWTGCDSTTTTNVSGDTCHILMNAIYTVTVRFNLLPARVFIIGSPTPYQLIQTAFENAVEGNIVQALTQIYTENPLTFNSPHKVSFAGGYDSSFLNQTGFTTVAGKLVLRSGSLTINRLKIM
jgi:hypothetical protein